MVICGHAMGSVSDDTSSKALPVVVTVTVSGAGRMSHGFAHGGVWRWSGSRKGHLPPCGSDIHEVVMCRG
jgi:hypothetical protein